MKYFILSYSIDTILILLNVDARRQINISDYHVYVRHTEERYLK